MSYGPTWQRIGNGSKFQYGIEVTVVQMNQPEDPTISHKPGLKLEVGNIIRIAVQQICDALKRTMRFAQPATVDHLAESVFKYAVNAGNSSLTVPGTGTLQARHRRQPSYCIDLLRGSSRRCEAAIAAESRALNHLEKLFKKECRLPTRTHDTLSALDVQASVESRFIAPRVEYVHPVSGISFSWRIHCARSHPRSDITALSSTEIEAAYEVKKILLCEVSSAILIKAHAIFDTPIEALSANSLPVLDDPESRSCSSFAHSISDTSLSQSRVISQETDDTPGQNRQSTILTETLVQSGSTQASRETSRPTEVEVRVSARIKQRMSISSILNELDNDRIQ